MGGKMPIKARFYDKVWVNLSTGCWEWTSTQNGAGYGSFRLNGRTCVAHRVAYELLVGPIPAGMELDHLCRVRHCVSPDHLEPVTPRTNLLRGMSHQAINAKKTHCHRGHLFDTANTYVTPRGSRSCRACNRRSVANYKSRRSERKTS